jgi:acyl carrier protein
MTYIGHDSMEEWELHFLLSHVIQNPVLRQSSAWGTQIMAAVSTPALVKKEGQLDEHAWMQRPVFRHLYRIGEVQDHESTVMATKTDIAAILKSTSSLEEAGVAISAALAKRLSSALSVPQQDIDTDQPVHAYGVDSLVAVELQFWFKNEVRANVPVLQILSGNSIQKLGILAAKKSELVLVTKS